MLGGVGERLAGGADDRAGALVQPAGPDGDQLDDDVEAVLDLLGRRPHRGGEVVASSGAAAP